MHVHVSFVFRPQNKVHGANHTFDSFEETLNTRLTTRSVQQASAQCLQDCSFSLSASITPKL